MEFYAFDHQKPCLFTCHICPKIFAGADFLRSHLARKHKKETVGLRLELDRHFATNFGEITRAKALEDFEHFKLLINANSTAINNDFERSPDLKTDTENSQLKELEDCLANLRGAISQLKSDFHSLKRHSDSLKTVQLNNEGIQTEELLENNFYEIPNHQIEKQKETNSLIPSIKLPENFEENEADSVNSISTQSDICNLQWLSPEMKERIKQDVKDNLCDILVYFGVFPEAQQISYYDYTVATKRLTQKRKLTEKKFPNLMALREGIDNKANKLLFGYMESHSNSSDKRNLLTKREESNTRTSLAPKHIMDINDKELYESIIRTNTPNQEKINKEKLENSIVECPSDIEESASMGLRRNSFDSTLVDRKSDKFIVSADVHCANSINSETFGSLPEVEIKERLSEWLTTDLSSYHPVVDSINRKPNNRRPSVNSEAQESDNTSVWAESTTSND